MKTPTIAAAAALSLASIALGAERDIQIRSVDFETGVFELHNCGSEAIDLSQWRFCTHDEDQVRRYTAETGLVGVSVAPGGSVFIHTNNDAAGAGERAFTKMFVANRGWQVGLAAFTFLTCLPTFYLGFSAEGDTADQLLRAGLYGGAALGSALMAAIPLLWLRTLKRSGEQAFAALPLARVSVDAGAFVAGCPSCGARLNTGGEVAVVCGHCQTQSLLPQPLVDARMKGRHKRVIELRLAGQTAAHGAAQHAVTQWQKKFVPMIIGINVLVGIVIFAAVIAYQLAKP